MYWSRISVGTFLRWLPPLNQISTLQDRHTERALEHTTGTHTEHKRHKPANSRTRRKTRYTRTQPTDATHAAPLHPTAHTPHDTTHRSRRRQPHAAPPRDARSASERRHEVGLRHLDRVLGVLRRAQRLDALERRLAPNRGELRAREADQLRVAPAVARHLACRGHAHAAPVARDDDAVRGLLRGHAHAPPVAPRRRVRRLLQQPLDIPRPLRVPAEDQPAGRRVVEQDLLHRPGCERDGRRALRVELPVQPLRVADVVRVDLLRTLLPVAVLPPQLRVPEDDSNAALFPLAPGAALTRQLEKAQWRQAWLVLRNISLMAENERDLSQSAMLRKLVLRYPSILNLHLEEDDSETAEREPVASGSGTGATEAIDTERLVCCRWCAQHMYVDAKYGIDGTSFRQCPYCQLHFCEDCDGAMFCICQEWHCRDCRAPGAGDGPFDILCGFEQND